jgi:predicted GIY-YIG superfamily endonuclease
MHLAPVIAGFIPANHCGARRRVGCRNESGNDKTTMLRNNFLMPYYQKRERIYSVYIMASKKNGRLYMGVIGDLPTRVTRHRERLIQGFTKKYKERRR